MCSETPTASIRLGTDGRAASKARNFLRKTACMHCEQSVDTAELLVSELVTNALRHGAPPIEVAIHCKRNGTLEVRVRDGSRGSPVYKRAGVWDESGRGVELVERMSDAWGVKKRFLGGKVVWFRLRC
jgi:two-component sensor histidine kinase